MRSLWGQFKQITSVNRVMDVNAIGTRHARACQCHWGRIGLVLPMPLGPGRPELVNAHGTSQCPWGRTGLDL